jgi:hypothetical protein
LQSQGSKLQAVAAVEAASESNDSFSSNQEQFWQQAAAMVPAAISANGTSNSVHHFQ